MLKEKKSQIVKAEKQALLEELNASKEVSSAEAKKEEPKAKTAEDLALEHKKKMAEAIKAVIKTNKTEQDKLSEKKVILSVKTTR